MLLGCPSLIAKDATIDAPLVLDLDLTNVSLVAQTELVVR